MRDKTFPRANTDAEEWGERGQFCEEIEAEPSLVEVVEEPAPCQALPMIVHLSTEVKATFGVVDRENNVLHRTPITLELEKLNAQTLTVVLARLREERQRFAEAAAEAGIV